MRGDVVSIWIMHLTLYPSRPPHTHPHHTLKPLNDLCVLGLFYFAFRTLYDFVCRFYLNSTKTIDVFLTQQKRA